MHHVHWRLSAHAGHAPDQDVRAHALGGGAVRARPLGRRTVLGAGRRRESPRRRSGWRATSPGRRSTPAGGRGSSPTPTCVAGAARSGSPPRRRRARSRSCSRRSPGCRTSPRTTSHPSCGRSGRRLTRRTTVVVLSPMPGPSLTHEMERLRRRGSDVIHVVPAGAGGRSGSGLMMRSLTAPDDAGGTRLRVAVGGRRSRRVRGGRGVLPSRVHPGVRRRGSAGPRRPVPAAVPRRVRRHRGARDPLPIVDDGCADRGRRGHHRRRAARARRRAAGGVHRPGLPARRSACRGTGVPRLARAGRRHVPVRRARPGDRVGRRGRSIAGLGSAAHRPDARVLRRIPGEPGGIRVDDRRRRGTAGRTNARAGCGAR